MQVWICILICYVGFTFSYVSTTIVTDLTEQNATETIQTVTTTTTENNFLSTQDDQQTSTNNSVGPRPTHRSPARNEQLLAVLANRRRQIIENRFKNHIKNIVEIAKNGSKIQYQNSTPENLGPENSQKNTPIIRNILFRRKINYLNKNLDLGALEKEFTEIKNLENVSDIEDALIVEESSHDKLIYYDVKNNTNKSPMNSFDSSEGVKNFKNYQNGTSKDPKLQESSSKASEEPKEKIEPEKSTTESPSVPKETPKTPKPQSEKLQSYTALEENGFRDSKTSKGARNTTLFMSQSVYNHFRPPEEIPLEEMQPFLHFGDKIPTPKPGQTQKYPANPNRNQMEKFEKNSADDFLPKIETEEDENMDLSISRPTQVENKVPKSPAPAPKNTFVQQYIKNRSYNVTKSLSEKNSTRSTERVFPKIRNSSRNRGFRNRTIFFLQKRNGLRQTINLNPETSIANLRPIKTDSNEASTIRSSSEIPLDNGEVVEVSQTEVGKVPANSKLDSRTPNSVLDLGGTTESFEVSPEIISRFSEEGTKNSGETHPISSYKLPNEPNGNSTNTRHFLENSSTKKGLQEVPPEVKKGPRSEEPVSTNVVTSISISSTSSNKSAESLQNSEDSVIAKLNNFTYQSFQNGVNTKENSSIPGINAIAEVPPGNQNQNSSNRTSGTTGNNLPVVKTTTKAPIVFRRPPWVPRPTQNPLPVKKDREELIESGSTSQEKSSKSPDVIPNSPGRPPWVPRSTQSPTPLPKGPEVPIEPSSTTQEPVSRPAEVPRRPFPTSQTHRQTPIFYLNKTDFIIHVSGDETTTSATKVVDEEVPQGITTPSRGKTTFRTNKNGQQDIYNVSGTELLDVSSTKIVPMVPESTTVVPRRVTPPRNHKNQESESIPDTSTSVPRRKTFSDSTRSDSKEKNRIPEVGSTKGAPAGSSTSVPEVPKRVGSTKGAPAGSSTSVPEVPKRFPEVPKRVPEVSQPATTSVPRSFLTLFNSTTGELPLATLFNVGPPSRPIENNGTRIVLTETVISRKDAGSNQFDNYHAAYILGSLGLIPMVLIIGFVVKNFMKKRNKCFQNFDTELQDDKANFITPVVRQSSMMSETSPPPRDLGFGGQNLKSRWEFPRSKLRLQTLLGQGNFGQVWKAEADDLKGHIGLTRLVAVKTIKDGASDKDKQDLLNELAIMQKMGNHPNVVTLLGCCTEKEPYLVIMEYVMYGKLLTYLRDHRTRRDYFNFSDDAATLTSRDLTVFAYCVARGMEYLSSIGIIHRDLAARNVLVDHNKLCKIADFGMSRIVEAGGEVQEQRVPKNALPVRWMAVESLLYNIFTSASDVWSFGVLLWEIVTLGSSPYANMGGREVMRLVCRGHRLERPKHCRQEFFTLMEASWAEKPKNRPTFTELRERLHSMLVAPPDGDTAASYVDLESFRQDPTCYEIDNCTPRGNYFLVNNNSNATSRFSEFECEI